MTYTSPQSRRLGWVVGLTSTAYLMVVLDALVVISASPSSPRCAPSRWRIAAARQGTRPAGRCVSRRMNPTTRTNQRPPAYEPQYTANEEAVR